MITHRVKLHPKYFDRIRSGQKRFEIRKNDRDYQVGDMLSMYPYLGPGIQWGVKENQPEDILAVITYMTTAYQQDGYCVLGIDPVDEKQAEREIG